MARSPMSYVSSLIAGISAVEIRFLGFSRRLLSAQISAPNEGSLEGSQKAAQTAFQSSEELN